MRKHYRITSAPRFITFIIICSLILIYGIMSIVGMYNANGLTAESYHEVHIMPGDTLWDIASEYNTDGRDIREVVYDICEINDISAYTLEAGDTILVPEYL